MEVVQVEEHEDQAMEPSDHLPQDRDQDLDGVIGMIAPTNDMTISTNIVKGKRTKRQRPQSPIPFRMHVPPVDENQEGTNASKSEEASSDICSNVHALEEECRWGGSTEEEEEIATCLILLAQGQSLLESSSSPSPISPKQQHHQPPPKEIKYTSRKFLETPHGSKAGYYVYECKTCFKTFPSFQALGGHRASHMRPKKDDGYESTRIIAMTHHQYSLADDHESSYNNHNNNVAAFKTNNNSLSLNPGNKVLVNNLYNNDIENELGSNNNTNNGKKQRVHRCSTCGAEFSSGQALGGHMRRHRGPVGGGAVGGALFSHGVAGYHDHQSVAVQQSMPALSFTRLAGNVSNTMEGENLSVVEACKLSLDLDLNLPAPPDQDDQSKLQTEPYKEEEDEDITEQQRSPTRLPPPPPMSLQQQEEAPVLTPPPSLVDCHN